MTRSSSILFLLGFPAGILSEKTISNLLPDSYYDGRGQVTYAPGIRTLTLYDRTAPIQSPQEKYNKRANAALLAERTANSRFEARTNAIRERAFQSLYDDDDIEDMSPDEVERAWYGIESPELTQLESDRQRLLPLLYDEAFADVVDDVDPPLNAERVAMTRQYVGVIQPASDEKMSILKPELSNQMANHEPAVSNHARKKAAKLLTTAAKAKRTLTAGSLANTPLVKWYSRPKPKNADWSVRMVHMDRKAIIYDAYRNRRIDLMAKYGIDDSESSDQGTMVVSPTYRVAPRNILNLWNANPLTFFTDRSGHSRREKRVRDGIYTDGETMYRASYDYVHGRNGMKPLPRGENEKSSKAEGELELMEYLKTNSMALGSEEKWNVMEKLSRGEPDVVLEGDGMKPKNKWNNRRYFSRFLPKTEVK